MKNPDHLERVERIPAEASQQTFIPVRARRVYRSSLKQPDIFFSPSVCNQFRTSKFTSPQIVSYTYEQPYRHTTRCLKLFRLRYSSFCHAVHLNERCAKKPDLSLQICFGTVLDSRSGSANIFHNGSAKTKRIARSVPALCLIALVQGFRSRKQDLSTIQRYFESHGAIFFVHQLQRILRMYGTFQRNDWETTAHRVCRAATCIIAPTRFSNSVYVFQKSPAGAFAESKLTSALEKLMDNITVNYVPQR